MLSHPNQDKLLWDCLVEPEGSLGAVQLGEAKRMMIPYKYSTRTGRESSLRWRVPIV